MQALLHKRLALPPIVYTQELHTELRLRGLPFDCTASQVAQLLFCHGYAAQDSDIHFCGRKRRNGRAIVRWGGTIGEAFHAARVLHGAMLGERFIEAFCHCREVRTWCSTPVGEKKRGVCGQVNLKSAEGL